MILPIHEQVTSLEISKRLKELGVRQDSFFIYQKYDSFPRHVVLVNNKNKSNEDEFAAYSVAELGELILESGTFSSTYWLRNFFDKTIQLLIGTEKITFDGSTEADCRGLLLIYLIEKNIIKL